MNTSLENFNSSDVNLHGFLPISGDNFSDHPHPYPHPHPHQQHHHLGFHPLMSLQDGATDHDHAFASFNFNGDHHQPGNYVYDPVNPAVVDPFGLPRVDNFMDLNTHGFLGENKGFRGKKRKKSNEEDGIEKPKEVVHVRAKRGEATDSHSLAERMRREKINEKLRRLQDQVPGCYKTMGMSTMLDVIINYVRSLQNQIEFLSMKLSAASMFYDFNSSELDDAINTMKQGTNGHEAQVMERVVGEGYGGDLPHFQTTWSS